MQKKIRKFRKYTIGYLHLDALYTPKINKKRWYMYLPVLTESQNWHLFGCPTTRLKTNGTRFLNMVLSWYPYPVHYILTDNGFEFTYQALVKSRRTKKIHPFDQICHQYKIQHRTIKFKHPWTNGMVERFNQKVKRKYSKSFCLLTLQI